MARNKLTKDEAKAVVERELEAMKLKQKMSAGDQAVFCADIDSRIEFSSKTLCVKEIRTWVERWQSRRFPMD